MVLKPTRLDQFGDRYRLGLYYQEKTMADSLMVGCGICGGPLYMHTCTEEHNTGHLSVLWSECHQCGERYDVPTGCPDCRHG